MIPACFDDFVKLLPDTSSAVKKQDILAIMTLVPRWQAAYNGCSAPKPTYRKFLMSMQQKSCPCMDALQAAAPDVQNWISHAYAQDWDMASWMGEFPKMRA